MCVCVQSNATSTFLLSCGNAVGPPDSIGGRCPHGIRSGNPVASVPHTNTYTHTLAGRQTVSAVNSSCRKKAKLAFEKS